MSHLNLKNEAIELIKKWQELVAKIDLTDDNILGILKCLDFSYMYDAANNLKIVQGYLFNEENKPKFMREVSNLLEDADLIKGERQRLNELLFYPPEKYLEFLLFQVKEKKKRKNKLFTDEHESKFYLIMITIAQVNIQAINKFMQKNKVE